MEKGNIVLEKGKIELIDVNPLFVWRLKKSLRGGGNFSNFIFDFFLLVPGSRGSWSFL